MIFKSTSEDIIRISHPLPKIFAISKRVEIHMIFDFFHGSDQIRIRILGFGSFPEKNLKINAKKIRISGIFRIQTFSDQIFHINFQNQYQKDPDPNLREEIRMNFKFSERGNSDFNIISMKTKRVGNSEGAGNSDDIL